MSSTTMMTAPEWDRMGRGRCGRGCGRTFEFACPQEERASRSVGARAWRDMPNGFAVCWNWGVDMREVCYDARLTRFV